MNVMHHETQFAAQDIYPTRLPDQEKSTPRVDPVIWSTGRKPPRSAAMRREAMKTRAI